MARSLMVDQTRIPLTVGEHMSPAPVTIEPTRPLGTAQDLMRSLGIRHLPVTDRGQRLIGMVTARDIAEVKPLPGVHRRTLPVELFMSENVNEVSPDAPLRLVAARMAERKLDSVVVVERGKVVGVFTTTDACRALASVLYQTADEDNPSAVAAEDAES
jgi:acetoin utilization protein AcuB